MSEGGTMMGDEQREVGRIQVMSYILEEPAFNSCEMERN